MLNKGECGCRYEFYLNKSGIKKEYMTTNYKSSDI